MPQELMVPSVATLALTLIILGETIVNAVFGQPLPATAMTCTQIVADAAVEAQMLAHQNPTVSAALRGTDVVGTVTATPLPGVSPRPVPTPAYSYDLKQSGSTVQVQTTDPTHALQRVCAATGSTAAEGPAPNSTLTGTP